MEVMTTLTILIVLGMLAAPLLREYQADGRRAACVMNLQRLGVAFQGYLTDHDQVFPTWDLGRASRTDTNLTLDVGLAPYVSGAAAFRCPGDNVKKIGETSGTSYFWNSALNGQRLSGLRFMATQEPGKIPLFGDKEAFHEGTSAPVNVLYADGRSSGELRFY
jgi:hypothetical protein